MQYSKRSIIKKKARQSLTGKYGLSMLVIVAGSLAMTFFALPITEYIAGTLKMFGIGSAEHFQLFQILTLILMLPANAFFGILSVGTALFFLNIACARQYSFGDILYGFRENPGKSFVISLVFILIEFICNIPFYCVQLFWTGNTITNYSILAAAELFAIVLQSLVTIPFSQCFFLMLDFPKLSACKIIKLSFKVMKGHMSELLLLKLSFIPIDLLGVLSLGIGYLWIIPYKKETYALFFLDIMNSDQA